MVGEESVSRNMEGGSTGKVGLQLGFWRGERRQWGGNRMSQTSEVRMAVVSPENEEESQVMGRRQGLFHVFHDLLHACQGSPP